MRNERNAGRKPKFNVPTKTVLIPIIILDEVNELSKPYKTIKKNGTIK